MFDHEAPDEYVSAAPNPRHEGYLDNRDRIRDYPAFVLGDQTDGQVNEENEYPDEIEES